MTTDQGDLGREVKARRLYLGYSQADVQRYGGPSLVTVRDIERGRQTVVRDLTLAGLDRALQWESGSAARVTQGGQPTPLPEPADERQDPSHAPMNDVLEAIRRDPNLLPEARAHLENQYQLLLRLQAADGQVLAEQQRRRDAADLEAADRARLDEQGRADLERQTDQSQSADPPIRFGQKRPRRPLR